MNRFSIVITVYEEYELLRQAYESIIHHVDSDSYKEIIIVDDHSNPKGKLREYLNYLSTLPKVTILTFDDYRVGFHCSDKDLARINMSKYSSKEKGFGHGHSLWRGIEKVTAEFVLCFDADSVFLKRSKTMLHEMAELFDKYEKVVTIGQLAGVMSDKVEVCEQRFDYKFGRRETTCGGFPGSPAFACRMKGWSEYGLGPIAGKPQKINWVAGRYVDTVFEKGYHTLNFPVFSQKYAYHVGGAIFYFTRPGRMEGKFGFCNDFKTSYGPRQGKDILYDWYAGRYILNMTTEKYVNYLRKKYSTPFDAIQEPLNEDKLKLPTKEIKTIVTKVNNPRFNGKNG